jgi:hypothetical protein
MLPLRHRDSVLIFVLWGGLEPNITEATTDLLYQRRLMMVDDEYGATDGKLGKGIRSTTDPTNLTRARTMGAAAGCFSEVLRIPYCLDNRPIDGGKVISPTHRPHSTPKKYYFSASGTHFC